MKFDKFSKKQLAVLTWWTKSSKYSNKKGIICTGAIRAGKTLSMSISFIIWAMSNYSGQQFGMSGKTAGAFERNVLFWTIPVLKARGYIREIKGELKFTNAGMLLFGKNPSIYFPCSRLRVIKFEGNDFQN